jgi:hypothetical protein
MMLLGLLNRLAIVLLLPIALALPVLARVVRWRQKAGARRSLSAAWCSVIVLAVVFLLLAFAAARSCGTMRASGHLANPTTTQLRKRRPFVCAHSQGVPRSDGRRFEDTLQ